jgi:hypothetical protein
MDDLSGSYSPTRDGQSLLSLWEIRRLSGYSKSRLHFNRAILFEHANLVASKFRVRRCATDSVFFRGLELVLCVRTIWSGPALTIGRLFVGAGVAFGLGTDRHDKMRDAAGR